MKRKWWYSLAILLTAVMLASGCGSADKKNTAPAANTLSITDDAGRKVTVPARPERITVLSTSFLDVLYGVGGKAAGRPSSKTPAMFPASQQAAEVGFVYNINSEQVVALQPDLIIGYQGIHEKLLPVLESSKIPVLMLKMKTYEDVLAKVQLFGQLSGTEDEAKRIAATMQEQVKAITGRLPADGKKVVILHATAKNVTVELENSIAGHVAGMLKIKNVAAGQTALEGDPEKAPYSLEKLVEGDPDAILIVTMGNMADIEGRMQADIRSNPAWAGLRAVKNRQVFFLPSELFQLNPGIRYPAAVEYMAKTVYPEVYGHAQ